MALTKYKEKRNFKESPEPTGGKADIETKAKRNGKFFHADKKKLEKLGVDVMLTVRESSPNL